MRLGQLARKLSVRPAQILDFLSSREIHIEDSTNTKVDDSQVPLIVRHFAPETADKILSSGNLEAADEVSPLAEEPMPAIEQMPMENASAEQQADNTGDTVVELIKAPKVELAGLKVLGKIELPEKKKPEPKIETEGSAESDKPAELGRQRNPRYQRPERSKTPAKNPIALQREREARETESRRLAELEREKQKRALHYRKKVKEAPPTKRVRMVEEPVEELPQAELREPPKTWWGKFMRWLNT
jgi:hypothetical protein